MAYCFLPTVPLVGIVVGVVSTGVIIVIVVCLLVACVFKKHKYRKNSPGEDYCCSATTALYSLLLFYTVPINYIYQKRMTTENRFVLSHLHVQICHLTSSIFLLNSFTDMLKKRT